MLILTKEQLDWLCEKVPDHPVSMKGGRPCANKSQVIEGVVWILHHGANWKDLPSQYGSKSTVHRWFKRWALAGVIEPLMRSACPLLEQNQGINTQDCSIEAKRSKGPDDNFSYPHSNKDVPSVD